MNGGPKHLLAFDGDPNEYEWYAIAETPEPAKPETHTVQPTEPSVKLFMPELFNADILEWSERYAASLLSNPEWHAKNERKQQEKLAKQHIRKERKRTTRIH